MFGWLSNVYIFILYAKIYVNIIYNYFNNWLVFVIFIKNKYYFNNILKRRYLKEKSFILRKKSLFAFRIF
jgi:hypothetical protein